MNYIDIFTFLENCLGEWDRGGIGKWNEYWSNGGREKWNNEWEIGLRERWNISALDRIKESKFLNLSKADLSKADLDGANLSEAQLAGATLSWANLPWANLSGANLSGANLSEAILFQANLSGAKLIDANLSGAKPNDANLSGAELNNANLSWANLSEANLSEANLSGADLNYANLWKANLSRANLWKANLNNASLFQANLSGAKLIDANLSGAYLSEADLSEADLYRAIGFVLDGNRVFRTNFSPSSKDPYSVLRRNYTGVRFVLVFIFSLLTIIQFVGKGLIYGTVAESEEFMRQIVVSNYGSEAWTAIREHFESKPVWQVVSGYTQGFWIFLLTVSLLAYNATRAFMTYKISGIRDAEERGSIAPQYRDYKRYYQAHTVMRIFEIAALLWVAWRVGTMLFSNMLVPVGGPPN